MASHLKRKLAIASFVEQLARRGLFDWQSAEHERTRCETEILIRLLSFQTDACDGLRAPKFLF